MDIQAALDDMQPKPRREITPEEIADVQRKMEAAGYRPIDPKAHRTLATFLLHRKHGQATRGLLLTGKVGTGKTSWLSKYARCPMITATELVSLYQRSKEAFYERLEPQNYKVLPDGYWDLTIDEIGDEPTLNDFGTKLEVISEALSVRYRIFTRWGGRTYITSNLTLEDIKARYGSRIESRLHEMCTHVTFVAPDQRRTEF